MSTTIRPSKKQRELLSFIEGFIAGHGYGPSYREIMRALEYKSVSTVAVHVNGLIQKGQLIKHDRSARSLEVVKEAPTVAAKTPVVSAQQEKWLVDKVRSRFEDYDHDPSDKIRDDLFVLVGALHVLGLEAPANAFKARLTSLAKEA
jgi:SOS-response transcriptional repressor LexA